MPHLRASRLVDAKGRPYFLRDEDLTIDVFRSRLRDSDPEVRAYYLGKLMRQAKPDDVFTLVTIVEITALFPLVTRYLGCSRDFWTWLLGCWKALPSANHLGSASPVYLPDRCSWNRAAQPARPSMATNASSSAHGNSSHSPESS